MRHINAEVLQALLQLDLVEAGFENTGFYPGISNRQLAMNSLNSSLLKKFHNDEVSEIRDEKALALFLECNERCRNFGGVVPRRLNEELVINEMKSIIYDFFNPRFRDEEGSLYRHPFLLNLTDISKSFGLGNGSNIGASSTDFYTKYVNSSMSSTSSDLPVLFRQAISGDKLWSDIEVFRHAHFGTEIVRGSRLSFVPKSRVISRTICTEPLLNMIFQKGIAGVLERRLRHFFNINLSTQPNLNSEMARIGSVDGSFGTIDLSSASDSISISMLKAMLPPEPFDWLMRVRSPSVTLPGGEEIELHMISSMGNGFTFPLQTILFSALVTAAYRVYDVKLRKPVTSITGKPFYKNGNYAVFGDDIIVDRRVYNVIVSCLEILGFSVNRDKSFNEGLFRESCGSDFYSGYNVRGVYLKKVLTPGDLYSAINRLNYWSAYHGIYLPRTISYLRHGCRFNGVPFDEADDSGIKIPLSALRTIRRDINGAIKYLALVNTPRMVRIPAVMADDVVTEAAVSMVRCKMPDFRYSSDGLLHCFLAGWLRDGLLTLRSLSSKAVLRRRVCPGWDERIAAAGESQQFCEAWKHFTEANLVS